MQVAIEDGYGDVLSKAMQGQGLGPEALSEASGVRLERVKAALAGEFVEAEAGALARELGLNGEALVALGRGAEVGAVAIPEGLAMFNTAWPTPGYPGMTVNAYLVWDKTSGVAAAFDSGADARPMVAHLEARGLRLDSVFITHSHGDHVADVRRLRQAGDPRVHAPEAEMSGVRHPVRHGDRFSIGSLEVEARSTPGHSPGGMSYVVWGLERPLVVVGDAIFALSVGRIRSDYAVALGSIRREILSLPVATIIAPGHGPLTTVGAELSMNPFFAEQG